MVSKLPLISLHLTERCNSRCVSCDYWRTGRTDISVQTVAEFVPQLHELGTQLVLISGGEPLLHKQWREIAELLQSEGFQLWLLTSGLSLKKQAAAVASLFRVVTVSLDGVDASMYEQIRGVDAFQTVCDGIRAAVHHGARVTVRVTIQRLNYFAVREFVDLARELGVHQISFLAADVSNSHAFGRTADSHNDVALRDGDLAAFHHALNTLRIERAEDFASGFIAESPEKLERIWTYYAALLGRSSFPPVKCNAPEFSAVIGADMRIHPCFFIEGPTDMRVAKGLVSALRSDSMTQLKGDIRNAARAECTRCVCSMWRDISSESSSLTELLP